MIGLCRVRVDSTWSADAMYHSICFANFCGYKKMSRVSQNVRGKPPNRQQEKSFDELCEWLEELEDRGEGRCYCLEELYNIMVERCGNEEDVYN